MHVEQWREASNESIHGPENGVNVPLVSTYSYTGTPPDAAENKFPSSAAVIYSASQSHLFHAALLALSISPCRVNSAPYRSVTHSPICPCVTADPLLLSEAHTHHWTDSKGRAALTGSKWVWHLNPGGSSLVQRSDHCGGNGPTRPPGPAARSQLGADKRSEREVLALHCV